MGVPVLAYFSALGEPASSGIDDQRTPLGPALLAVVVWPRCFRRRKRRNAAIAIRIRATAVTPTAMPAMAPVDRPWDPVSAGAAELDAVEEAEALPDRRDDDVESDDVGVGVGNVTPSFITTCICFIHTGEGLAESRVVIVIGTPVPDAWHSIPTTLSAKASI